MTGKITLVVKEREESLWLQGWKSGWTRWRKVTRDWHDILLRYVLVHTRMRSDWFLTDISKSKSGLTRVTVFKDVGGPTLVGQVRNCVRRVVKSRELLMSRFFVEICHESKVTWLGYCKQSVDHCPIYLLWESSFKLFICCERHPPELFYYHLNSFTVDAISSKTFWI